MMMLNPSRFMNDGRFQQMLASDEELYRFLHEGAVELPRKDAELLVASSGIVLIAGKQFPAPSAATFCLLEIIGSPFIANEESGIDAIDIYKALFILDHGRNASPFILAINNQQYALEILQKNKESGRENVLEWIEITKSGLSEVKERFDELALSYARDNLENLDLSGADSEINMYLGMAGGYDMLPDYAMSTDGKSRKQRNFDADWLTHIITMVTEVSNATPEQIMWDMPMAMASYLVMQTMRKAGVKGIGEKKKYGEAIARVKELMQIRKDQRSNRNKQ